MKRLLFPFLFITLISCSKDDIYPLSPLSGKWKVVEVTHEFPPVTTPNPKVVVSTIDYGCFGSYDLKEATINPNFPSPGNLNRYTNLVLTQDPNKFPISRRFIKNSTVWEFDKGTPVFEYGVFIKRNHTVRVYENGVLLNRSIGDMLSEFKITNGNLHIYYDNGNINFICMVDNNTMKLVQSFSSKVIPYVDVTSQITITLQKI